MTQSNTFIRTCKVCNKVFSSLVEDDNVCSIQCEYKKVMGEYEKIMGYRK